MREAYRAYIKDLWLANNAAGAKRYIERLCILEPSAAQDASLRPAEPKNPVPRAESRPLEQIAGPVFPEFRPQPTEKGSQRRPRASQAAFGSLQSGGIHTRRRSLLPGTHMRPGPASGSSPQEAQQLLQRAEEEFAHRRFSEARVLFEKAQKADSDCIKNSKDRWAYCLLNQVVEQLNQPGQTGLATADLQEQVRGAVAMAPSLEETGKWLLREIDQRQKIQPTGTPPEVVAQITQTTVRHLGRNKEGWQVTETQYFRIFHNQPPEQIEKVAAVAEKTRRDMYRKWFGNDGIDWTPKCELILHPTGNDYSRMTGVSPTSPGHSRIERDPSGQRVLSRRMDLRCDNPGMLDAILPHETTHVVLAGMFGNHDVPRWADEGIAVLTEPSYKVDQHRRNLEKNQQEGMLFRVQELMQLENYPEPRRIGAFYAQSVCLVEFMAELRGPQVFTTFVRDGLRDGYENALRKHYNMDMNELQQRWQQRLGQSNHVTARP